MKDTFIAYPAIFEPLKDDIYFVSFPDLPNTFTEGHGLDDAFIMASDVLAEMNHDNKHLPKASNPKNIRLDIETSNENSFVVIISSNLSAKKREFQKSVRKNVNIPINLAFQAESENLDLSKVLIDALRKIIKEA